MKSQGLVDGILTDILLSSNVFGDEDADSSYPPHGFGSDPALAAGQQVRYLRFFLEHARECASAMNRLQDARSRNLLRSLILYRILGYRRTKVVIDQTAFLAAQAQASDLPAADSRIKDGGGFKFGHFELPSRTGTLKIDCLRANVFFSFFLKQYYLTRRGVEILPCPGDYAVDAGACFGDTALAFADSVTPEGRVFSFEPLLSHVGIVRHNLAQNPEIGNVALFPFALGDRNQEGEVASGDVNPGFSVAQESSGVKLRTLDRMVEDGSIPKVDFVKMDIEGFELAALKGAEQTLRRFRPKLAISIYHNWEDYWTILKYVDGLKLDYRFYLENYTLSDGETILYASSVDRPNRKRGGARATRNEPAVIPPQEEPAATSPEPSER
jgi:FkbM family methyltransferase